MIVGQHDTDGLNVSFHRVGRGFLPFERTNVCQRTAESMLTAGLFHTSGALSRITKGHDFSAGSTFLFPLIGILYFHRLARKNAEQKNEVRVITSKTTFTEETSMDFAYAGGRKQARNYSKVALVGALHMALGYALVHSMATVHLPHQDPPPITVTPVPPPVVKPLPPPPPTDVTQVPPPTVVVPPTVIDVLDPPPPTIVATVQKDEPPQPPQPPAVTEVPPGPPAVAGGMATAVLAQGCATPDYPMSAARNGDSGTTTLALLVGPDGAVQRARVEHSSGSRELDRAAQQALSLCKFKPAVASSGQAQAGWARLDYVWKLDG
jgi:protein TonB